MTRRYEIHDLLRLRNSPLCVRPKDLSPSEDWIGQAVEERSRRNQLSNRSQRDSANVNGNLASTKSISLDFNKHGRQSSNSDVAGRQPASPSSRDNEKSHDYTSRTGHTSLSPRGDQSVGMGRFGLADREHSHVRDRNSTRFGISRYNKDDGDSWLANKSNRRFDSEEGERFFQRRNDRENGGNGGRENGRDHHKRFGSDAVNEGIRSKDWRNGDRNSVRASREWGSNQEQDPEWMGEEKSEQEPQRHTADDFEAWKRSMKAHHASSKSDNSTDQHIELHKVSSIPQPLKKAIEAPLLMDSTEDKFFELWAPSEPVQGVTNTMAGQNLQQAHPKANKSSKFTGFFATEQPTEPNHNPKSNSTNTSVVQETSVNFPASEDQQGIQRILEMLKNKPNISRPSLLKTQKNRTPPPQEAISTSATPPLVSPRPKPHGVQSFLNPQSPAPDANSQFLLNLMKSKDTNVSQQPSFTQQLRGLSSTQIQPPNSQFDRSLETQGPPEVPHFVDKLNPSALSVQQRRHVRGDSYAYEDPSMPLFLQNQGSTFGYHPGFNSAQVAPNIPPGLGPPSEGLPSSFGGQRGPVGMPPGFGQPGPFRNSLNYPPGFGLSYQINNMSLAGESGLGLGHGSGHAAQSTFTGSEGYGRPPPGFGERNKHTGVPVDGYDENRRNESGMWAQRD